MAHVEDSTTESTTTTSTSEPRAPILAVDMDETIIQSDTEELVPGARDALLALRELGWKIIIWTCRGDADKHTKEILDRLGIPYDAVNDNLPGVHGHSRKIMFDAVVDNKNVDLSDGWEKVVRELEKRRRGWQDLGITKATVFRIDPDTGTAQEVQRWALKNGRAILVKGDPAELCEFDLLARPENGVEFLKSLQECVNGTYSHVETDA